MTPLFTFIDGSTARVKKPISSAAFIHNNKEEDHILVRGDITPQELKGIKAQLRDGKTGLVSAIEDDYGRVSNVATKWVGFNPEATIVVSAERIKR